MERIDGRDDSPVQHRLSVMAGDAVKHGDDGIRQHRIEDLSQL